MTQTQLGQVYIFKVHNFCKIGCTRNNVETRKSNVNTLCPYPVEKVYATELIPCYQEIEKRIHAVLSSKHTHGEWYYVKFNTAVKTLKDIIDQVNPEDERKKSALIMHRVYEEMTRE